MILWILWGSVFVCEWFQQNVEAPPESPLFFYTLPSCLDALAFSAAVVWGMSKGFGWWGKATAWIAAVTVVYDLWFWQAYYLNVWIEGAYTLIPQALFLISAAILALAGGYDVFERIGSFLASLRDVSVRPAGVGWARHLHREKVLDERA